MKRLSSLVILLSFLAVSFLQATSLDGSIYCRGNQISVFGMDAAGSGARITTERLTHVFGKAEHNLGGLVKSFGSEEKAFLAVQDAANQALARGSLTVGRNGVLPTGDLGNIVQVGGQSVRLIGGRVVDGVVSISSFSMKGHVP